MCDGSTVLNNHCENSTFIVCNFLRIGNGRHVPSRLQITIKTSNLLTVMEFI